MNFYTKSAVERFRYGFAERRASFGLWRHTYTMRTSRCWFAQQIVRRGCPNILRPSRKLFQVLRQHVPRLRQPLAVKMPF